MINILNNNVLVSLEFKSFDYLDNKNWGVVANDMFWGANGNLQGGFLSNGMGLKYQIGSSLLTNPTNVYINTVINNTLTK